MANFFESDTSGSGWEGIPTTESQEKARSFIKSLYKNKVSYPTQQVAGMSEAETKGQDLLSEFLGTGSSAERNAALSFLTGLLDMPVSVTELPEIKALMSTIESETSDLVNQAMRRTQISGMGTSSAQQGAVGRELAKGKTSMVAAVLPYMQQLFSGKLTAADLINSLVTSGETAATNKIGAAMTYGALPREIEQAGYDATYNKQVSDILARYNLQLPAAQTILNEPRYAYNAGTTQPSTYQNVLQGINTLTGAYKNLKYPDY